MAIVTRGGEAEATAILGQSGEVQLRVKVNGIEVSFEAHRNNMKRVAISILQQCIAAAVDVDDLEEAKTLERMLDP